MKVLKFIVGVFYLLTGTFLVIGGLLFAMISEGIEEIIERFKNGRI